MIRITDVALHRLGGPLGQAVQNAHNRWADREGLLLVLTDETGAQGIGEASPLPGHSPETLADCAEALAVGRLRGLALPTEHGELPGVERPGAARFAWETACTDLRARRAGVTFQQALTRRPVQEVPLHALVGSLEQARAALGRHAQTLKLKLGTRPFHDDLRLLVTLRHEYGPRPRLRLDANGAWSLAEAREHLHELAPLDIEFVEQPVPKGQLAQLGRTPVPFAADESLLDPSERAALWAHPDCVAVVIKPALLGLFPALALAAEAKAHHKGVVVTHLFDGPVGLTAARWLAMALPDPPLACGLATHAGLAAWPAVDLPIAADGPRLLPPAGEAQGLGFAKAGVPWDPR